MTCWSLTRSCIGAKTSVAAPAARPRLAAAPDVDEAEEEADVDPVEAVADVVKMEEEDAGRMSSRAASCSNALRATGFR